MENSWYKKTLVFGIIVLFIYSSFMPITGSLIIEKQATQESLPFAYSTGDDSDISLITVKVDGETGLNDWYVDDVRVNFTKSYDISEIKYQFDAGAVQTYTEPFYITTDSTNHDLRWWANDYEGNQSEIEGPFYFKQDQTPPVLDLMYEWSGDKPPYLFTFIVTATDDTSGMERVEFYMNGKLKETVYGPGPKYVWELYWVPTPHTYFRGIAYDMAGNSAYDEPVDPLNIAILESPLFSKDIGEEKDSHQSSQCIIQKTEIVGIEKELYSEKPKSDCSISGVFDVASLVVVVNRKMLNDDWIGSDFKITMIPDPYDIKDVYYKLDDIDWMNYIEPLVISEDGFHTFWWYIVDIEGNISIPDSISFKIDITPPEINLIRERLAIDKVKFIADVYDETSNIDRVEFHIDNYEEFTDYDFPYEWIYNGFERHTITSVVYDKAGNSNGSSLSTWRSKSDQQTISIPSSQNVISVIPSNENKINNTPACSFIKDSKKSSEQILSYETIVYAFMGTGFYAFGPGNITRYRDWEGYGWFSGGTWTNDGRLLCWMHGYNTLCEVDPKTFDVYAIGDSGIELNGLSYDPVTEKLYGASSNGVFGGLYEVDPETGEQTYIGDFVNTAWMIAIAFDADGVLYGWDISPDYLYTINTSTGEATPVGPLGINLNYAQDGDFDKDEDILYLAAFTLSPGYGSYLYECDEDTGECTLVGTLGDGFSEVGAWAISYELNMEPPVTTASFDPPYPDGCNGWYASNVTVILNATDNTGVIATYYRIDGGEWKEYNSVSMNITISEEGKHTIEYYSYDYVGNIEDVKSSTLYIDKTPPKTSLKWKVYSNKHGGWYVKFTVNATDAMSGMDRVEMYINDELHETITYPGPNYYFIINWSSEIKTAVFKFIAFDIAGNSVYKLINGSDIKSHPRSKSSTYQFVNSWLLRFLDRFLLLQRLLTLQGVD
jgi:hypothetical protein